MPGGVTCTGNSGEDLRRKGEEHAQQHASAGLTVLKTSRITCAGLERVRPITPYFLRACIFGVAAVILN